MSRSTVHNVSLGFGVFYLAIGVLGFVPGITVPGDHPGHGLLLGIFAVNTLHNLVHLIAGAGLVTAALSRGATTQSVLWLLAAVFAVLVPLSVVAPVVEGVAINAPDTLLHLASALLTAYLGFAAGRQFSVARA
jgi:hypothetical protein